MKLNITKMGDGYVVTQDNETQEVFHKDDLHAMLQKLGILLMAPIEWDSSVIQLEITVRTEEFIKEIHALLHPSHLKYNISTEIPKRLPTTNNNTPM